MPTLRTYRRQLGYELGGYGVYTATSGTTTTLVCPNAFKSSSLPSDAFAYQWVYCPDITGVKLRRITSAGLNPTTGTITVDNAFDVSIAVGVFFELSALIPPTRETVEFEAHTNMMGLDECVNLALRHLLVRDESPTITLVSGQRSYSLSSHTFLDRPERLLDVQQLDASGATYVSTWRLWELRESGDGHTLFFPNPFRFSSGSYTAKLVCLRPADTRINETTGGSGLSIDTDSAEPDVNTVVCLAKAFAYRAIRDNRRGVDRAKYQDLYVAQVQEARRLRQYDKTNDIDPLVPQAPAPSGAS